MGRKQHEAQRGGENTLGATDYETHGRKKTAHMREGGGGSGLRHKGVWTGSVQAILRTTSATRATKHATIALSTQLGGPPTAPVETCARLTPGGSAGSWTCGIRSVVAASPGLVAATDIGLEEAVTAVDPPPPPPADGRSEPSDGADGNDANPPRVVESVRAADESEAAAAGGGGGAEAESPDGAGSGSFGNDRLRAGRCAGESRGAPGGAHAAVSLEATSRPGDPLTARCGRWVYAAANGLGSRAVCGSRAGRATEGERRVGAGGVWKMVASTEGGGGGGCAGAARGVTTDSAATASGPVGARGSGVEPAGAVAAATATCAVCSPPFSAVLPGAGSEANESGRVGSNPQVAHLNWCELRAMRFRSAGGASREPTAPLAWGRCGADQPVARNRSHRRPERKEPSATHLAVEKRH